MAKYGSDKIGFFLVDGYSPRSVTTELSETKEAAIEESHALGDSWVANTYVGVKKLTLEQDGYYDDAAASVNAALVAGQGTSRIVCYNYEGNTLGKNFVGFEGAMQVDYTRIASRDALHRARASYQGNGQLDEGKILHVHQAETTDPGTGTSVDNTASSAGGGAGYLQVSALTLGGFTSVTIKIRHSTDNVTFVDLITFATVTAAPAKERLTVTGTVNRYLRIEWDFIGAGSGQSVTFMSGFARG